MATDDRPIERECVEGYVFVRDPFELLVLRRPPERGSLWAVVSGRVELTDASFQDAVVREVAEETGFSAFTEVFPLGWEFDFDHEGYRWRLHAFGLELPLPLPPTLSDEHVAAEWLGYDDALRRLHFDDNRQATRLLKERLERNPRLFRVAGVPVP